METELQRRLHGRTRHTIQDSDLRQAAVLLPLFKRNGAYHVLFIERSRKVEHHKGEISFPGGLCEESDGGFEGTALRETHEEIGMRPEDVRVLGLLDDMRTQSTGYRVTPVVGIIPYPYPFVLSVREVEQIITIPLAHFLDPGNGGEESVIREGIAYRGHVYRHEGHVIWGATARILTEFIRLWNELTHAHRGQNYP
jgi:8-oxo-dGTP pyrophosphatase MutT (NUDIX family)